MVHNGAGWYLHTFQVIVSEDLCDVLKKKTITHCCNTVYETILYYNIPCKVDLLVCADGGG